MLQDFTQSCDYRTIINKGLEFSTFPKWNFCCITVKALTSPPGSVCVCVGGGLIRGGGAYLKFFDRQRQNYTMCVEFEILRSFDNNHELLRYTTNTIKN